MKAKQRNEEFKKLVYSMQGDDINLRLEVFRAFARGANCRLSFDREIDGKGKPGAYKFTLNSKTGAYGKELITVSTSY